MTTFAVLATGPSMSQAVADSVRHHRRIAVNDAFRLARDADALVANDAAWWKLHRDAIGFAGRKFAVNPQNSAVERVYGPKVSTTTNSTLLAMHVAIQVFGATRVELYGVDMSADRGAHYFGPHVGLANTKPARFDVFKRQFAAYSVPAGVSIVNHTKGSALQCFPFAT